MQPNSAAEAARMLAEAGRTGNRLADLPPGLRPATRDEAYLIQDALIDLHGAIGGWKVAPVDRGSGRICVPIPMSQVYDSPATVPVASLAPALEVEIAVRLARDLPDASREYTSEEVADAIASLHLAIEVVGSRFIDRALLDPLLGTADMGNNAGIVVGPPVTNWRSIEASNVSMRLSFDSNVVGSTEGGWTTAEMLEAVAALAAHSARRNGGLKASQVVITGARIKPVVVPSGARIEATAFGFGPVRLSIR